MDNKVNCIGSKDNISHNRNHRKYSAYLGKILKLVHIGLRIHNVWVFCQTNFRWNIDLDLLFSLIFPF